MVNEPEIVAARKPKICFRERLAQMKRHNDLKEQNQKSVNHKILSVLKESKDRASSLKQMRDKMILIKQVMGGKNPLLPSQQFQDQVNFIQSTLSDDNSDALLHKTLNAYINSYATKLSLNTNTLDGYEHRAIPVDYT